MTTSSRTMTYTTPGSDWWLVLLNGIASIVLGFFLVTNPVSTISVLVMFLGFYWLVSGVFTLISLAWNRQNWGWKLFMGALGIIAGFFIVQNPILSTIIVPASYALWLGVLGVIFGVSELIQAFRGGGWGLGILAVLSIIAGFFLITRPVVMGFSLAVVIGIFSIVGGVLAVISSFSLRRMSVEQDRLVTRTPSPLAAEGIPMTGSDTSNMPRTSTPDPSGRPTGTAEDDPSELAFKDPDDENET